jgi:transposase
MADGPNLDDDSADETDRLRREHANLSACNRLTTIPGVGPITVLAFRSTIDIPQR